MACVLHDLVSDCLVRVEQSFELLVPAPIWNKAKFGQKIRDLWGHPAQTTTSTRSTTIVVDVIEARLVKALLFHTIKWPDLDLGSETLPEMIAETTTTTTTTTATTHVEAGQGLSQHNNHHNSSSSNSSSSNSTTTTPQRMISQLLADTKEVASHVFSPLSQFGPLSPLNLLPEAMQPYKQATVAPTCASQASMVSMLRPVRTDLSPRLLRPLASWMVVDHIYTSKCDDL
jgi:hypothetical protein